MWIVTALALGAMALGALTLDDNLTSANGFRGSVEAVKGQQLLQQSFPAGASAPTTVLVPERTQVDAALAAARGSDLVAAVGKPETGPPGARFSVTLKADPFSKPAFAAIGPLREELRAAAPSALVGGPSAEEADVRAANAHDTRLLVPLVLVVVFAILVLLLRAVAAPLMLMATVVLSFFAAVGGSLLLLDVFADFPGEDPSYALYSLHLPRRARGRLQHLPDGPRARGGAARTRPARPC